MGKRQAGAECAAVQDGGEPAPKGDEAATADAVEAPAPPARRRAAAAKRRRKAKVVRWSARREARFLEALALTASVTGSARAAGVSDSGVYRRRRTDAAFRARWEEALREGLLRLETAMLDRALNGVEKPVWFGGRRVGAVTEYNDRMAMALLARHGDQAPSPRLSTDGLSDEALRARLAARLAEMHRRLGGDAA